MFAQGNEPLMPFFLYGNPIRFYGLADVRVVVDKKHL
jgi:hypothetical protein